MADAPTCLTSTDLGALSDDGEHTTRLADMASSSDAVRRVGMASSSDAVAR